MKSAGKNRSSRHSRNRVGTSGHRSNGYGRSNGVRTDRAPALERLGHDVGRDVVEELGHDVERLDRRPSRSACARLASSNRCSPTSRRRLARRGHHRGEQDHQPDRHALADQGRGEPAERLGHHDEVRPVAHRLHDGVRVLLESRRVVVGRQVRRDGVVPARLELGTRRCQYQASDPAPWIRTKVLTRSSLGPMGTGPREPRQLIAASGGRVGLVSLGREIVPASQMPTSEGGPG